MQPYFLPYLGYWQLMALADEWVVFDLAQYRPRSWMNRNRILHPDPDHPPQYIQLPVARGGERAPLRDVQIDHSQPWREKLVGQLTLYRRLRAPHSDTAGAVLEAALAPEIDDFCDFCIHTYRTVFAWLELPLTLRRASAIELDPAVVTHPGGWAPQLAAAMGADRYVNAPGGVDLFDEAEFAALGVELRFLRPHLTPYRQSQREFTPGLSIVDAMMFVERDELRRRLLEDFSLLDRQAMKETGDA